jgi:hypothetical protein
VLVGSWILNNLSFKKRKQNWKQNTAGGAPPNQDRETKAGRGILTEPFKNSRYNANGSLGQVALPSPKGIYGARTFLSAYLTV